VNPTAQQANLVVRTMLPSDVDSVIDLQLATMPTSVLTQLGRPFLRRFHEIGVARPDGCALVAATHERQVAGFALATRDADQFEHRITRGTLPQLMLALLNPSRMPLIPRFAHRFVERGPTAHVPGELLLLAVHPAYRRRGLARTLLSRVEEALRAAGLPEYRVAVRTELTEARAFYRAVGFREEGGFIVLGEPMTYLVRTLG
jgi:ribosomal protein S18 acetylase RimI-like enzyme